MFLFLQFSTRSHFFVCFVWFFWGVGMVGGCTQLRSNHLVTNARSMHPWGDIYFLRGCLTPSPTDSQNVNRWFWGPGGLWFESGYPQVSYPFHFRGSQKSKPPGPKPPNNHIVEVGRWSILKKKMVGFPLKLLKFAGLMRFPYRHVYKGIWIKCFFFFFNGWLRDIKCALFFLSEKNDDLYGGKEQ